MPATRASTRAPAAPIPSRTIYGVAAFTGILRLERAAQEVDLQTLAICEKDSKDRTFAQRYLGLPDEHVDGDILRRNWELWVFSAEVLFLLACAPCRIVAKSGKMLGLDDDDAAVTVSAWADMADRFNLPFVAGENHENLALARGGEVLVAIDERHRRSGRLRTPLVDGAPLGGEFVRDTGVAEVRGRMALDYSHEKAIEWIGPSPRLESFSGEQTIFDVLLPPDEVPSELVVDGTLEDVPVVPPISRVRPTVCARLTAGGRDSPLFVGSHVRCTDDSMRVVDERILVLWAFTGDNTCLLFFDDRLESDWVKSWPVAQLQHEVQTINVHYMHGVAGTTTDFGVPPLWHDKQLVLDQVGRPRRFAEDELYRLGGDPDGPDLLKRYAPEMSQFERRRRHGKSLAMPLARAIARRLRWRIDDFIAVRAGHALPFGRRAETLLAPSVCGLGCAAAVVVFLHLDDGAEPRALVSVDPPGLPGVRQQSDVVIGHRDSLSAVARVISVYNSTDVYTGTNPVDTAWRAGEATSADVPPSAHANVSHVIACPLGPAHQPAAHPTLRWMNLGEIRRHVPAVHDAVHQSMASLLSQQTHE